MRAEMERCRQEGTPRPESSAVRAHVPACFWAFTQSWQAIFRDGICDHAIKELCRVYVSRTVKCEYCGNQRSEQARGQGLTEGQYDDLLNEHQEVMAGTAASMAPGFATPEELAASKSSQEYWAKTPPQ
jgi:AhpD family alkylhydroperoxidase